MQRDQTTGQMVDTTYASRPGTTTQPVRIGEHPSTMLTPDIQYVSATNSGSYASGGGSVDGELSDEEAQDMIMGPRRSNAGRAGACQ